MNEINYFKVFQQVFKLLPSHSEEVALKEINDFKLNIFNFSRVLFRSSTNNERIIIIQLTLDNHII